MNYLRYRGYWEDSVKSLWSDNYPIILAVLWNGLVKRITLIATFLLSYWLDADGQEFEYLLSKTGSFLVRTCYDVLIIVTITFMPLRTSHFPHIISYSPHIWPIWQGSAVPFYKYICRNQGAEKLSKLTNSDTAHELKKQEQTPAVLYLQALKNLIGHLSGASCTCSIAMVSPWNCTS